MSRFDPHGDRRELIRLVRQIQALTLELRELERGGPGAPEFRAKQRRLDQLRWRLAVVARRAATGDLGAAA